MIILRKLGKQSGNCRAVITDSLIGVADGNNQTFYVSYEYVPGGIEIAYNGQSLISGEDFEETGPKEITFTFLKPLDISLYSANYEAGDCEAPGSPSLEPGPTNFLELEDTPNLIDYNTVKGQYVRARMDGNGLEFVEPEREVQEGIMNVPSGIYSTSIIFDHEFASDQYVLTVGLENRLDSEPSVYPTLIKDKTTLGFTIDFSDDIDSDNYYLNWRATSSGSGAPSNLNISSGGSGIDEIVEDTSPELGGNLEVGSNLVMLDISPNNTTVSGGYVRGYSGEASAMNVSDNSSNGDGFGAPLYMRSDGTWATCTAVSGSAQMPCAAMALEPGDGGLKKILWKGIVRKGEWSWTPGKTMYVSTVEGALTDVMPNDGHWKQPIGVAIGSDTIRFDPGFNSGI